MTKAVLLFLAAFAAIFVKLERRLWFFDEAGWLETSLTQEFSRFIVIYESTTMSRTFEVKG